MTEEVTMTDRAEALVTWAAGLLSADGPTVAVRRAIGEAVRRLGVHVTPADDLRLASLHDASAAATVLARAIDGPVLMLARFPSEAATPVHNHNSWGIVCVIRGRDRYLKWDRRDDGADPNRARLVRASERELGVGEVVYIDDPPGDIHSQQGIDGPVWELVFFGRDPDAQPRAYFEPEAGTVTHASSAR